jgi:hypothetical protein
MSLLAGRGPKHSDVEWFCRPTMSDGQALVELGVGYYNLYTTGRYSNKPHLVADHLTKSDAEFICKQLNDK